MQVVNSNSNDLLSQLQRHDQAFCSLMELVPAELYFPQEPDEIAWTSKYAKVCAIAVTYPGVCY